MLSTLSPVQMTHHHLVWSSLGAALGGLGLFNVRHLDVLETESVHQVLWISLVLVWLFSASLAWAAY